MLKEVRVEVKRVRNLAGNYRTIDDAINTVCQSMMNYDQEHMVVLCLDCQQRAINVSTVGIGDIVSVACQPRDLFRTAILQNAYSIIVFHNHPSGDPTPSGQDNIYTQMCVQAGKLLGVEVYDHIVVGRGCYYSYRADVPKLFDKQYDYNLLERSIEKRVS